MIIHVWLSCPVTFSWQNLQWFLSSTSVSIAVTIKLNDLGRTNNSRQNTILSPNLQLAHLSCLNESSNWIMNSLIDSWFSSNLIVKIFLRKSKKVPHIFYQIALEEFPSLTYSSCKSSMHCTNKAIRYLFLENLLP